MGRIIKNIVGVLILVLLLAYIWQNWGQLQAIIKINPLIVTSLMFFFFLGVLNNSRISQLFMNHIQKPASFLDMVILQNATRLINHLPLKIGTVVKANYLKRRYGIEYSMTVNMLIHQTLLTVFWSGTFGLGAIFHFRKMMIDYEWIMSFIIFFMLMVVGLTLFFVSVPDFKRDNKICRMITHFIHARKNFVSGTSFNSLISFHVILSFLLTSIRFYIIYLALGYRLSVASTSMFGVIGYCSAVWGLTPGGLGVRELLLGSFSTVTGIPFQVGVLAAMIDRAVILLWVFSLGLGCTIFLWRRYPIDFQASKDIS
jgi:uncharacterized membrane protein YbhN (UPF0104 family)